MAEPWKGSPLFWATCPKCGWKQKWGDAKTCSECSTRLYPTEVEVEKNRRNHAAV